MEKLKVSLCILVSCAASWALVTAIHIEPRTAAQSGWTRRLPPGNYVSQVLTINFDELDSASGAYCELFAGTKGGGGQYHVAVLSCPGGFPIGSGDADGNVDHEWVRFKIDIDVPDSIVKGKKLEFKFTRGGGDSIQYYYTSASGYNYGWMIAPYPNPISPGTGLAMRVRARLRPIDSMVWGASSYWLPGSQSGRRNWANCMRQVGAKWSTCGVPWDICELLPDSFDFTQWDEHIAYAAESAGMEPVGGLAWTPEFYSTRLDTYTYQESLYRVHSRFCPPRGLWASGDSNYWARYLNRLVDHVDLFVPSAFRIHTWSIWNESNEGATTWVHGDTYQGYTGFWRRPNDGSYHVAPWDTLDKAPYVHDMCSLYVRLCVVAESVITSHTGHADDRIIIGELGRVNYEDDSILLVPGKEWLRTFYDVADHPGNYYRPRFWHVVSAHPYQTNSGLFDPHEFEPDVETLRTAMRQHNDTAQLWNTEFNYGTPSEEANANSLGKAYTSILAQAGSPGGTYDRGCWWPSWVLSRDGIWALLFGENGCSANANWFAYRQTAEQLTGKRLNGRVMTGDTAIDDHTRIYEFEDTTALKKRTWVCWTDDVAAAVTPVPVRNDMVDTVALAYNSTPPASQKDAEPTGWLSIALHPRPVFVTETGAASRPDLVVDSVKYVPPPSDTAVLAWVTNRGNRATPRQSPGNQPYPTWAVLYTNGDSLTQQVYTDSIAVSQQVTFAFSLGIAQPVAVLFAVEVNPAQTYVELGTDDNSGYRLKTQP